MRLSPPDQLVGFVGMVVLCFVLWAVFSGLEWVGDLGNGLGGAVLPFVVGGILITVVFLWILRRVLGGGKGGW